MTTCITKTCPVCTRPFSKPKNESKLAWATRHVYCSKACYISSMRGRRPPGFVGTATKEPWNKGKSLPELSGPNHWAYSRKAKTCLECSVAFQVPLHRETRAKFCSRACSYKNRDRGISSENEKQRKSVAYKAWRQGVFERDDYTCQHCHTRGGTLNADHIKPFAHHPDLRFDLANGQTLCERCHRKTPTFGAKAHRLRAVANEA